MTHEPDQLRPKKSQCLTGCCNMNTLLHEDGSEVFIQPDDEQRECALVAFWEPRWKCKISRFPSLFPIDGYCTRESRVKAWVELRMRTCHSSKYETTIINADKFHLIRNMAKLLGIPGLFVVGYTDQTGFVDLCEISETTIELLERKDPAEGKNELVVHIPIKHLHLITWNNQ